MKNLTLNQLVELKAILVAESKAKAEAKREAEKVAKIAKIQEAKEIKARRRESARRVRRNKAESNLRRKSEINLDSMIDKFLGVCDKAVAFFGSQRVIDNAKFQMSMNLTLLASGSASTGEITNKEEVEDMENTVLKVELKMDLQLLADGVNVTIRDLSNIKNADKIVQKKWSVISNKKKGSMAGLVVRKDEKGKTGVTEMIMSLPENKFTRHLDGIAGTISIGNRVHTFEKENRFVDEFIAVSFDAASSQAYANEDLYLDLKRGITVLPRVNADSEVEYRNIHTGRLVKPKNLTRYTLALSTAAGLRGKDQLFNAIYVKLEEGETVASKLLNPYLHNIIKHINKDLTKAQAAKFMSRPGLAWTGSTSLGEIKCLAHYDGKFDFNSARNTFDGIGFLPANFVANKFGISEDSACKLSVQTRPGGVIKVQGKVLPTKLFNKYIKFLKDTGKLTVHGKGDVQFLYDNNSIKANIDLTNIELEILAIGRTSEVALSKQIIEKLFLEAAIMDRDNGNTEKTDTVRTFITELGKDRIDELMFELIDNDKAVSPDVEYIYDIINRAGVNTIPAAKKSAMANTMRTIAKLIDKLSFTDGNMFYSVIYTDTAQLFGFEIIKPGEIFYPRMRDIDNKKGIMFKYPSMGGKEFYSYKTISFDTICKRLNTIDMDDSLRKALKEDYKKMSDSLVVLPASREVFDSCAGMDIDMDAAALVFTDLVVELLHGKEEYVKLDSTPLVKQQNVQVSKEIENDAIARMNARMAKKAESNKNSLSAKLLNASTYNPENNSFYSDMFISATTGATKSIGEITFANNKCMAVATEAIKGNFAPIDALIRENIGTLNNKYTDYKGLPTHNGSVLLSEATIDNMKKEIKLVKLNDEIKAQIALDFGKCFRLYQETVIDAAKTGVSVNIAITVDSVELKSLHKVRFEEINTGDGPVILNIKRDEKSLKPRMMYINGKKTLVSPMLIEDDMSKIQDELIQYTLSAKKNLEDNHNLYTFMGASSKSEDGSMHQQILSSLDKFTDNHADFRRALEEIKAIYATLSEEYGKSMTILDDEDRSEEEKAILKDQFKAKLSNLSNSVERMLSHSVGKTERGTMMTRGAILIAIGALTKKGVISTNSSNKFAFNIAQHYALAYALADNKYSAECTVLHCEDGVEGEVKVRYGFAEDNSLIVKENFKDRENGEAILNVERLEDGTVRVTETKTIEIPEIDDTKCSMILDADIATVIDEKGEPVVDASGTQRIQAVCDAGKVLRAIEYKLFATKSKDGEVKFAFDLNGKEHSLFIPEGKIKFDDMKVNTKYRVTLGYLASTRGGRVVLELTK